MAKVKRSPHLRVTTEDIKWRYQKGFITVRGYIYDYLLAARRQGWKLRTTVKEFCQELGISRPAFYKALSDLRTDQELHFRFAVQGKVEMWIASEDMEVSTNRDAVSIGEDRVYTNVEPVSPNVDSMSKDVDQKTPQSLPELDLQNASDLNQISNISNHLSCISLPPSSQKEDLEIDLESDAIPNLVDLASASTALQPPSDSLCNAQKTNDNCLQSPSLQLPKISFLDWVKYYKANSAKNPLAYARACIKRDADGILKLEYQQWLQQRLKPCFSTYQPEPFSPPDPEANRQAIARAKQFLIEKGVLSLAT